MARREKLHRFSSVACVFKDLPSLQRIERIAQGRGHNKLTRTVRELVIERLMQLEVSGDPHAIYIVHPTPPGRSGADGVSSEPQPSQAKQAGALKSTGDATDTSP